MSVFINYNKNSKMTVEFELNNNGSVNMEKTIDKVYDIVEEKLDEVIGKNNGFSEIYDNELISKGRVFIKNANDEEEVLKRVKAKVKEMNLKLTLDKEPSMNIFYDYYYEFEIDIREVIITSQKLFKSDIMEKQKVKVFSEKQLEQMTDEQFDNLGCIYEETIEEEKDTMYNNQSEVIMALINTFKVDLRSTKAYKELINEAKRSTTPINTNQFYDVLYDKLFNWDCPMIDLGKNIKIECIVEDASFDYDYGSISSTHHCYIPMGYNIIVEDID